MRSSSKWASQSIYTYMRISGIYSITNLQNGKVYYGSSNNIEKRWNGHKSKLRKEKHSNPHLQSSWNKYGETSFVFNVEEEIVPQCLQQIEQNYLDWCRIFSNLSYNIGYDAKSPTRGIKFGPPSAEHRRKIGLANSGERSANFGKKLSIETRRRMSLAKRGVPKPPRTEEHKRNLGLACKGVNHYRYDNEIYTFYHPSLGNERCDRHYLISKYNLHKRCLGMVIEGKRKSYRGWRLL